MDSSSAPNTPNPHKDKESSANEEEQDEEDEYLDEQFDFEASIKDKSNLAVSSSNLINSKNAPQSLPIKPDEGRLSENDKERLEATKVKNGSTAFDMFAEDDQFETVSYV